MAASSDPWLDNTIPLKSTSFPAHGSSVITALLLDVSPSTNLKRIITASDDHDINVYTTSSSDDNDWKLQHKLSGHQGGVWALSLLPGSHKERNLLVSGSTDRTVRVWDLEEGRCKWVFGGHRSTVRCIGIGLVEDGEDKEKAVIVSGSRDHSLGVWRVPGRGEEEFFSREEDEGGTEKILEKNPYHERVLVGHNHAVRDVAVQGRTAVSGSYDSTVRIWDIVTGECKWVMEGHQEKVYSVALDPIRPRAYSGSMDSTVRVWDLADGSCKHVLRGHTSLVGLLGMSPSGATLVSAAADGTLRIWDPDTGDLRHVLQEKNSRRWDGGTGAITCFRFDDEKVLSGSDGRMRLWNVRTGECERELLDEVTGVWQIAMDSETVVAGIIAVFEFVGQTRVFDQTSKFCAKALRTLLSRISHCRMHMRR